VNESGGITKEVGDGVGLPHYKKDGSRHNTMNVPAILQLVTAVRITGGLQPSPKEYRLVIHGQKDRSPSRRKPPRYISGWHTKAFRAEMRDKGKEVGEIHKSSSPLVFSKLAIKRAIKAFEGWFEELNRKPHVEQIAEELRKRPVKEVPKVDVRTIYTAPVVETEAPRRKTIHTYEPLPSFGAPKGFVTEEYVTTGGYASIQAATTQAEVTRVEEKMALYEARDYEEIKGESRSSPHGDKSIGSSTLPSVVASRGAEMQVEEVPDTPIKGLGERLLFQKKVVSTDPNVTVPKKKKKEKVKVVISYDDDC